MGKSRAITIKTIKTKNTLWLSLVLMLCVFVNNVKQWNSVENSRILIQKKALSSLVHLDVMLEFCFVVILPNEIKKHFDNILISSLCSNDYLIILTQWYFCLKWNDIMKVTEKFCLSFFQTKQQNIQNTWGNFHFIVH